MKLRRMLALTLVLMTLTTAALAENHSGFYQPQENAAMDTTIPKAAGALPGAPKASTFCCSGRRSSARIR